MSDSVWIKSEPTVDGTAYVVTLEASDDVAVTLTPERALRYAWGVLDAAHRASYDAAVLAQLTSVGRQQLSVETVAQMVIDMREDRPPLDEAATAPLRFEPGVSQAKQHPFLGIYLNGERLGQWAVADAREHAMAVLEAVVVADLDGGYYRALTGLVGLEEPRARNVVADIANHRQ
ncbi:MAG: hypothetical protein ACRDUV_13425, partial [Pseudonocardiaceae bacterium]